MRDLLLVFGKAGGEEDQAKRSPGGSGAEKMGPSDGYHAGSVREIQ